MMAQRSVSIKALVTNGNALRPNRPSLPFWPLPTFWCSCHPGLANSITISCFESTTTMSDLLAAIDDLFFSFLILDCSSGLTSLTSSCLTFLHAPPVVPISPRPAYFSCNATSQCLRWNFHPHRWLSQIHLLLCRFSTAADLIASK